MIYLMANHSSVWKLRRNGHNMGWMIGYASWKKPSRADMQLPYAIDNGMYFPHGEQPHGGDRLCEFFGRCAKAFAVHAPLFAIVPDMPYDWLETVRRWDQWYPRCRELAPSWRWGIAVQDGATIEDIERLGIRGDKYAICVGGSSEWKDATIRMWATWCRGNGTWSHVLRVNDTARLNVCIDEGVRSVDGTGLFRGDVPPAYASDVVAKSAHAVCSDHDGFGEYGRP